ncbi:putative colanic acid biosysnthesis UDP-glucose lipid carrier transferase [Ferrimonas sediminum]|uniref:Putative colanic acid biosysnthesis UDP-glucose lipid carrier transferase n=1 Tax=Ferrimonas sediminum TaxID=718193 RepID=A0A1G8TNS4_9GAMM|nr:undecaprenyl-phosphate glucose phosphotransferase [Ferrimonas sediminum]SDJ42340.1 putative colanic acid biosysnthesis UDP-glucose lipid carrier transferase [Ferrimonas sediminum]
MSRTSQEQQGFIHSRFHGFAVLFRLADIAIVQVSMQVALWFSGKDLGSNEMLVAILATLGFMFFAESMALYRSWRSTRLAELLLTNWLSWVLASMFLLICAYFMPNKVVIDRQTMLIWGVLGIVMFGLFRLVCRHLIFSLRRRGFNTQTAAILGITESGMALARNLEENPQLGIRLIGFFDDRAPERIEMEEDHGPALLGCVDQAIKLARSNAVDILYIAMPMRAEERITEILMLCADSTAAVHIIPDFFVYNLLHARWHEVGDIQSLSVYDSPLDGLASWVKRVEDIVLSCVILALVSIPMLLISMVIKLTSAGPVLFKQHRYGLDGRKIMVWKFRTMSTMENGGKVVQVTKNDPRVTWFGGFLRRTSLDELPQFFNVLQGQMSVVGPRPHAVAHNEQYRSLISGYMLRHHMKPGITGWAQINGWRGETDTLEKMEKRLEFDLAYIRNWSVWFDIKIVFKTVFQGFTGSNAY